ncbi:3-deoxy-manno-octulosonate cytidylyltransferase [Synechococcus sp. GFB01]|uniref:3-deoxy-manno-octulosonate cytidylyltransferase n=1 Tax=Synechococcus sp. GFB01 TaxID=1662190 RepID=UPI00064E7293|nr:3-deoxy-manno-octulosonate cytidylyltransferase [Synechococcus sp. GFB01]KMM16913.1 3-deoxy-manno-octulosonate cytidylyltransferase [Synechococcus sp. GFB01]
MADPGAAAPADTLPAVVVAVPARLRSARLPGKVMAEIGGKPMLRHVLERCAQARGVAAVLACTDSPEVLAAVRSWGFDALATAADCGSGSERLASVADTLLAAAGGPPQRSLVINVQGDQPLLDPAILETMVSEVVAADWPPVITPVYPLPAPKIHDPNVVKVLRASDGRAITFSRSALPHVRDLPPDQWHSRTTYWGHVGIYGYRADLLAGWGSLPASPLEELEKLEQLRLIDAGIPITTFVVEGDCFSVDTPEQLEQARRLLAPQV